MRIGIAGPLLALWLTATSASAEEPPLPVHFEAGLRAGLGLPVGNAVGPRTDAPGGTPLSNLVAWSLPLQLDAGARVGPVFVGGYLSWAYGKPGSAFDGASARSASDVRFGFEVLWHFAPDRAVDPWAGLGVGYEWLNLNVTGPSGTAVSASFRGFEWVNVQLGVDFMLGRNWRLGPFVQARVGQYDTGSLGVVTPQGAEPSGTSDLPSKSAHAWIDVGVRLGFLL
ncbi:MAG: autotransporter outer membrane beta-barrel domain-containing protein [Myxococcaceae bacterium]